MGRMGFPYYGEDLGSAIQDAEKLTAKITKEAPRYAFNANYAWGFDHSQ